MASQIEQLSFLNGANATFVAELFTRFLDNPGSVDQSWAEFFGTLPDDAREMLGEMNGASWAPRDAQVIGVAGAATAATAAQPAVAANGYSATPNGAAAPSADQVRRATMDSIRALMLIRA